MQKEEVYMENKNGHDPGPDYILEAYRSGRTLKKDIVTAV
jgi:hypothetical protein